jgi:hypothetical protein
MGSVQQLAKNANEFMSKMCLPFFSNLFQISSMPDINAHISLSTKKVHKLETGPDLWPHVAKEGLSSTHAREKAHPLSPEIEGIQ